MENSELDLHYTWQAITKLNKEDALFFAQRGEKFLNDNKTLLTQKEQMIRNDIGYHIVSIAYLWNDFLENAFSVEKNFLKREYYKIFREQIEQYLELLIVKKQKSHLISLFDDIEFRDNFFNHYQAFTIFFIDKNYIIKDQRLLVAIIQKLNGLNHSYGDQTNFFIS